MKKASKAVAILIVFAVLLSLLLSGMTFYDETLVVYNWEDYMDLSVLDTFKAEYFEETGKKLKIVYSKFDTNETMVTQLLTNKSPVDLVCPSEYAIEKLMKANALRSINMDVIENYSNVDSRILDSIGKTFGSVDLGDQKVNMLDYFVPYMWGTLGILYNADIVTEEDLAQGWGLLWNKANNPALNGKILMKDSIRDVYVSTLLYCRENNFLPEYYQNISNTELINTVDDTLIALATKVLTEQKPVLKGYEVDFGKDDLISGAAYIDLAWSGDALYAIEEGEAAGVNLDYYVPPSGSNLWFDGWVIPKNAKNPALAEKFINFLCRTDIAMYNTMFIGYTSSLSEAAFREDPDAISYLVDECEYDLEEYFADERRYPPDFEVLSVMEDFGRKNEQTVQMWETVKAESSDTIPQLFLFIGVIALVVVAVVRFVIIKEKRYNTKRKVE